MGINFLEKRREQLGIPFASDYANNSDTVDNDPEKMIKGIRFCKGLVVQPHPGDVFGLLAGSGVGKTTTLLTITKDVLLYNEEGYVILYSLEMKVREVMNKVMLSFGNDHPELLERLIIIDCYNSDGSNKELTISDIKLELKKIKQTLGGRILMTAIDHFHEIHNNGSTDFNPVAKDCKNLAVELDTLLVIPSQTTKEKGQGDIPVKKDGCFGCSRYENLCSFILTIFQPLRRVQNECDLPALGWQLCKIRNKRGKRDSTKEEVNYVLKYVEDSEDLVPLNEDEKLTFQMYYEKVQEMRRIEDKDKGYSFDLSSYIKGKDGRDIKIEKFAGKRED